MTEQKDLSVELTDVTKSFSGSRVVDGISFSVSPGEVLGLIGPNGAGKTTTIRMIMDIIKADSGTINVLGRPINEAAKNSIGYLPEERGLYLKTSVIRVLTYLATLKGMKQEQAVSQADALLQRVGLGAHRDKKVAELSRGMSQLVQFLTAIIHQPRLVILDEPFANLDPVNTELLKDIVLEMKQQGCAVILSTHRMNDVEESCDRVFMINRGKNVLYGEINEVKSRFSHDTIRLEYSGRLGDISGVNLKQEREGAAELSLEAGTSARDVLRRLVNDGLEISRFEVSAPPLNEIFLMIVGENGKTDE